MTANTILIIEDEANIASFVAMYLKDEGFAVKTAASGSEGLRLEEQLKPVLVILDIMLPYIDGFEVCRRLRARSRVPIIMLTARDTSTDKVVGLELGADDYVTKPFEPRELVARVKSLLRRAGEAPAGAGESTGEVLSAGEVTLDSGRHEVTVAGEQVKLTAREFELLHFLMHNRGLALTRQQLLERVWGYDFLGDTRTIDVHVNQLRRKLGDGVGIETVWGVGYKLAG